VISPNRLTCTKSRHRRIKSRFLQKILELLGFIGDGDSRVRSGADVVVPLRAARCPPRLQTAESTSLCVSGVKATVSVGRGRTAVCECRRWHRTGAIDRRIRSLRCYRFSGWEQMSWTACVKSMWPPGASRGKSIPDLCCAMGSRQFITIYRILMHFPAGSRHQESD